MPKVPGVYKQDMATPPKTSSSKSISAFENKSRNSVDFNVGHLRKDSGQKQPITQKLSFENKIRKFMDKSDTDKELEEKVKMRLK